RFVFLRTKTEDWLHFQSSKLVVDLRPETISGKSNPSFVGFRQPHLKGYATTHLEFTPAKENEQAGLVIFQNENHYYFLCMSMKDGREVVQLFRGPGNEQPNAAPELMAIQALSNSSSGVQLKIEAEYDH